MIWLVAILLGVLAGFILSRLNAPPTRHKNKSLSYAAEVAGQIGLMVDGSRVALEVGGTRRIEFGKMPDTGSLDQTVMIWVEEGWVSGGDLQAVYAVLAGSPTVVNVSLVGNDGAREVHGSIAGSPKAIHWMVSRLLFEISDVLQLTADAIDVVVEGGMSRAIWRRTKESDLEGLRDREDEPWLIRKAAESELRKLNGEERDH